MSNSFQKTLDHIRSIADSEAHKGRLFERLMKGIVKLSRILGFWRRNRSALELRINNLGSVQGAEQVLKSINLTSTQLR